MTRYCEGCGVQMVPGYGGWVCVYRLCLRQGIVR